VINTQASASGQPLGCGFDPFIGRRKSHPNVLRARSAVERARGDENPALGILVAPGSFYGEAGREHVRIALTATDERIAAAAERLAG